MKVTSLNFGLRNFLWIQILKNMYVCWLIFMRNVITLSCPIGQRDYRRIYFWGQTVTSISTDLFNVASGGTLDSTVRTVPTILAVNNVCTFAVTSEAMDQYFRWILGIKSGFEQVLSVIDPQCIRYGGASGAGANTKTEECTHAQWEM